MFAPPIIHEAPGRNGTPPGACSLTGSSHVADGPYAMCHNGQFYSRQAVVELADAFGDILLRPKAQKRFELLLRDLADAQGSARAAGEEMRSAVAEAARLSAELDQVRAERDALARELNETQSAAQAIAAYLADDYEDSAAAPVVAAAKGGRR